MNKMITACHRLKYLLAATMVALSMTVTIAGDAAGADESGLSLTLLSDPQNLENLYPLSESPDDPIKLFVVLKNISGQNINTDRGVSQVELHRTLKITDPCGTVLELRPEADVFAYDAPPPKLRNGLPVAPAESLPPDFVRSLTISDLRELFPVMKELPGLYTVEAQLPGARYVMAFWDVTAGLQGVTNHPANWFGTIDAGKMQIYIAPVSGARLQIRLEDVAAELPEPLFQVPVKVFQSGDLPAEFEPEAAWSTIEPVLSGSTGIDGAVEWECDRCLPQGSYTILAKYQDKFQSIEINGSNAGGWGDQCTGLIAASMLFGQEPPLVAGKFSVFGLNSVEIDKEAIVLSGDVGANAAGDELEDKHKHNPKHKSDVGIKIDKGAQLKEGTRIFADRVKIEKKAVVYDVYYNELENKGQILGEMVTPLELPVWEPPVFLESSPGKKDVKVKGKKGKRHKKSKKGILVIKKAQEN